MMKLSLTLLAGCLLAAPALADVRSDIARRYVNWDNAYRRHDVSALGRILAPGFRLVTGGGKTISRSDYVASLGKSQPPKVYHTRLLRVRGKGLSVRAFTEETSGVHRHRYQDRWSRIGGRWLLTESKTLDEK